MRMDRVLVRSTTPSSRYRRRVRRVGIALLLLLDRRVVRGRRCARRPGGLIHFTHHDPAPAHEGGWIELKVVRYQ